MLPRVMFTPKAGRVSEDLLVSVIISSFNYARFLHQAIDSALSQTYPAVEVVVVDDGSKDESPEIIRSYGSKIISLIKENGGQASALNAGFERSRGNIVIFLDSDDFLLPQAAERVAEAIRPCVSKVQYRLKLVGSRGELLRVSQGPQRLSGMEARDQLLKRGWYYPMQPTSGNAFARWGLKEIFPIPEQEFPICPDGYLNVMSPFLGDVLFLEDFLACYRLHGANQTSWVFDLGKVAKDFEYHDKFQKYLVHAAAVNKFPIPKRLEMRNYIYLRARLASLRFAPKHHPLPGDRSLPLALHAVVSLWRWWQDLPWGKRVLWSIWFLFSAAVPVPIARRVMIWSYSPDERPRAVRAFLSLLRRA